MPWKESVVRDERLRFVRDAQSDRFTMSDLCARYGVSRRIGYKWLARYDADGRRGLVDQSRAPHECPHRPAAAIVELLVTERTVHPFWGARKLLKVLSKRHARISSVAGPQYGGGPAGAARAGAATPAATHADSSRRRPAHHG